jgi:hypothetical protein
MKTGGVRDDSGAAAEPMTGDTAGAVSEPVAWEMIEAGRYRPRRIKGSFPGRELG